MSGSEESTEISPQEPEGGMADVRDDIVDLTTKAPDDFDGLFRFPMLTAFVFISLAMLIAPLVVPFWVVNKLYTNRVCSAVIAVPTTFVALAVAGLMGDLVGSMNQAVQDIEAEIEEMGESEFFACEACDVAPAALIDIEGLPRDEPPGACDHCGAELSWEDLIEVDEDE